MPLTCNNQRVNTPIVAKHTPKAIALLAQVWCTSMQTHGVEAHVTLTHQIRAREDYNYYADDGTLCRGQEWHTFDATSREAMEEFLGYV